MKKILIFAAHPDDDILGCGGLISKYSNSSEIRVVFIGEGSSCRFSKNKLDSKIVKDEIKQRNQSGIKALNHLGVNNFHFHNLPCGRFDEIPLIEINQILESEIIKFKPDSIFTHSKNDANNDHKIIYKSSIIATRPGSKFLVKNLFTYEILSSSEWNFGDSFLPNYFVELSEFDIRKKIDSMMEYKTEILQYPYPRSEEGIITLAKLRGMQSFCQYAEAFKSIRIINK